MTEERRQTRAELRAEQNKVIWELKQQRKSFSQISEVVGIGVNAVIVRLMQMEEKARNE
jgi:hypothetical protein